MARSLNTWLAKLAAASLLAMPGVRAQEAVPQPPPAPAQPPGEATPTRPAPRVVEPVGVSEDPNEQRRELLREGAFLSRARGELRRLPSGRWAFVFNPDSASGLRLPPMIVLPCMTLAAMQQIVESRREAAGFAVSGQVFIYENANYLLPTDHAALAESAEPAAQPEASQPAPPRSSDTAEDLIRNVEKATPSARPSRTAAAPEPAPAGVRREGETLVLRRGRLVRGANGWMELTLDNDADSAPGGGGDASMALLPCMNVQLMERLWRERGEQAKFVVSGRVFVYQGRNYLLPTMFQVAADAGGNLVPAQ